MGPANKGGTLGDAIAQLLLCSRERRLSFLARDLCLSFSAVESDKTQQDTESSGYRRPEAYNKDVHSKPWKQQGCLHIPPCPGPQRLTFFCRWNSMEERQGSLATGWGLGVAALLPGEVQLGVGEGHIGHSVEYLHSRVTRRLYVSVSQEESTGLNHDQELGGELESESKDEKGRQHWRPPLRHFQEPVLSTFSKN